MKNFLLILIGFLIGSALAVALVTLKPTFEFSLGNSKAITPQPKATPTFAPKTAELTGWFASWDQDLANSSLTSIMGEFKTFAPMLYRVMPNSTLGRHGVDNRTQILNLARERNIPIAPVVTDESDTAAIYKLLTDSVIQNQFIDSLISEAGKEDFDGWSIDIEELKGSDEKTFSSFIKNMSEKLHAKNLKLYVIVYGRQEKEDYDPAKAHNFQTLGQYADQIQIMTYNYNNEYTAPGGQTPLKWYRSVLLYAVKSIPREKILVGLSTHGYDWGNGEITGLTYPDVMKVLENNDVDITFNPSHSAQVGRYKDSSGKPHTIYYEDAKSIEEKMKIAQTEFGINKFAFWRLSAEDPKIWDVIRSSR